MGFRECTRKSMETTAVFGFIKEGDHRHPVVPI